MDAVLHFFAGASASVSVKLFSSVDDVLWLSRFLTPNLSTETRVKNALVYAGVCLLQTCLAFIISTGGETAMDEILKKYFGDDSLSSDKLLTFISGTVLGVYSIVLGITYYREEIIGSYDEVQRDDVTTNTVNNSEENDCVRDDDEACSILENNTHNTARTSTDSELEIHSSSSLSSDEGFYPKPKATNESTGVEPSQNGVECQAGTKVFDLKELTTTEKNELKPSSLLVIAFIGSLDDLTLFVPLLVGKTFHIFELVVGAMIAVLIILCFCFFLVRCEIVSDFIQRIPVCLIVFSLSIFLLVKGIIL